MGENGSFEPVLGLELLAPPTQSRVFLGRRTAEPAVDVKRPQL